MMEEKYFPARPVQQPRVPIWMVGIWPRMKSMRRVLKCDGLLLNKMDHEGKLVEVQPKDLRQMKEYIQANRALDTPFDLIAEGQTHGLTENEIAVKLRPWMEAGATWWIETPYGLPVEQVQAGLSQGPPRLEQVNRPVSPKVLSHCTVRKCFHASSLVEYPAFGRSNLIRANAVRSHHFPLSPSE